MQKITSIFMDTGEDYVSLILVWRGKKYHSYYNISGATLLRLKRFGFTNRRGNNLVNPLVKMSLGYK